LKDKKDKHNLEASRPSRRTTPRDRKSRRIHEKKRALKEESSSLFPEDFSSLFKSEKERIEFLESTFLRSSYELAEEYSVSSDVIRKWKREFKDLGEEVGEGGFPTSVVREFDDYVIVKDNPILIIGDAEVPEHDAELFDMAMSIGQKFGVETLIINGDFIAMDSFSCHGKTAVSRLDFEKELEPALESVEVFLRQFKQIVYLTGNHERRLSYKSDGHLSLRFFFRHLADDVAYSEYAFCIAETNGVRYLVCHPKNYSRVALSVPTKLASIKLMNIVSGHTHRLAVGYDQSDSFWVVESGHCRDKDKTRYKSIEVTTHPEWNAGFVLLINGIPFTIDKRNFEFWARVVLPEDFIK
jgi:predicted phosphodiesterase